MIICFSAENKNIDSILSSRFENGKYFIFIDDQNKVMEAVPNKIKDKGAAYLVAEKRPDMVITGNIAPNSFDFLAASGIKIASGVFGISVREAFKRYAKGKIKEVKEIPGAGKGRIL